MSEYKYVMCVVVDDEEEIIYINTDEKLKKYIEMYSICDLISYIRDIDGNDLYESVDMKGTKW